MLVIKPTANILAKQDAGTDVNFDISAMDITNSTGLPAAVEEQGALSSTAAALVTTPASGHSFVVSNLVFTNTGSSVRTVTVYRPEDGSTVTAATTRDILTLNANETAEWTPTGWVLYNSSHVPYSSVGSAASQTEQETATSNTVFVTPANQQYHPSSSKCWGKATNSGGASTLQVSYNTTSVTHTATDRFTITIATDFSTAHYSAQAMVEAATTTYSATTTSLIAVIRNATLAAGSFVIDVLEFDIGQATDPSSYAWACFGDL